MTTLLTVGDVAEQIGVSKEFVYLQIEAGLLAHVRVGTRSIRLEQTAVDEYIARGRHAISERTTRLLKRGR